MTVLHTLHSMCKEHSTEYNDRSTFRWIPSKWFSLWYAYMELCFNCFYFCFCCCSVAFFCSYLLECQCDVRWMHIKYGFEIEIVTSSDILWTLKLNNSIKWCTAAAAADVAVAAGATVAGLCSRIYRIQRMSIYVFRFWEPLFQLCLSLSLFLFFRLRTVNTHTKQSCTSIPFTHPDFIIPFFCFNIIIFWVVVSIYFHYEILWLMVYHFVLFFQLDAFLAFIFCLMTIFCPFFQALLT